MGIRLAGVLYLILGISLSSAKGANPPCDFKGVSVGDTMSTDEIMSIFGIKSYKTNPTIDLIKDHRDLIDKYGIMEAHTIVDFEVGPYCENKMCIIPNGITIGNNNVPVYVFVGFGEKIITSIEVYFNQSYWEDVKEIAQLKYGRNSSREIIPITIAEYSTKKFLEIHSENITFNEYGLNQKTNDRCRISLSQFDSIFNHNDPLGVYHSVFNIELISKNF